MKITINSKNLIPDETWQKFRKVRAIVENEEGYIAISIEGGKCIFPGGKCEPDEPDDIAIKREITEETGIDFFNTTFHKLFELETLYDDFYDYRSDSLKSRYTLTTYYYVKTSHKIDEQKMQLTEGELKENFKIKFVDRETLEQMLLEDHSEMENGRFFDEENKIVYDKVLKK